MKKKALITGVTGQDGAYLARFLLEKEYEVHGVRRHISISNTERIDDLIEKDQITLHYADMTDSLSLVSVVQKLQPDEIYNLAALSDVAVSFQKPELTANIDGLGALRLLEAIRIAGLEDKCRYYQASTSELYGSTQGKENCQNETTPFYAKSPYAVAKLYSYWITVSYREAYKIYACNGILFNHESPIRGKTFVTRKITCGLSNIKYGLQETLKMGNLDALRDWGHAKEYVEAQWMMLQKDKADDYVIATGKQISVRNFINIAAKYAGMSIKWTGTGKNEVGIDKNTGNTIIVVDPKYYRPNEVEALLGDPSKANKVLGWKSKTSIETLAKEMMESDLEKAKKRARAQKT